MFGVPALIEGLSTITPLLPGDIIFCGTPAGVGQGRTPTTVSAPGEVLVSQVEGIGELRQRPSLRSRRCRSARPKSRDTQRSERPCPCTD